MLELTPPQRRQLRGEGYTLWRGALSPERCDQLVECADAIVAAELPNTPLSIFTTDEQERNIDAHFLGSAHDVRLFFEAEAIRGGEVAVADGLAVNKIGHALHAREPAFIALGEELGVTALARAAGMRDPLTLQSMLIFKPPQIGGAVAWHQDNTFLFTSPPSTLGLWIPLADADCDNGTMWVLPGAHRGPLRRRFVRTGDETHFVELETAPLATEGALPLEVERGTVVLFDGNLPHKSDANRSQRRRPAYTLHVVDGACDYAADNWLPLP